MYKLRLLTSWGDNDRDQTTDGSMCDDRTLEVALQWIAYYISVGYTEVTDPTVLWSGLHAVSGDTLQIDAIVI